MKEIDIQTPTVFMGIPYTMTRFKDGTAQVILEINGKTQFFSGSPVSVAERVQQYIVKNQRQLPYNKQ